MNALSTARSRSLAILLLWGGFLITLLLPRLLTQGSVNTVDWVFLRYRMDVPLIDPSRPCLPGRQHNTSIASSSPSSLPASAHARLDCMDGDLSAAYTAWQEAHAAAPSHAGITYNLALTAYALGRPVTTRFNTELSAYAAKQGRIRQGQKDMDIAVAWYRFALYLAPNMSAAAYLAGIYRAEKEQQQALAVWDNLLARLPETQPDYWWARGLRADMESAWEDAARAYERAASLAPADRAYGFYLTAGDRWVRVKVYDNAEAAYRKALGAQPNRIDAYLRLGNLARSRREYNAAIRWYRLAGTVAPTSYVPPYYLGLTARGQKRYEEALQYFDRALALAPKATGVWYYKALTLDALDRRREATEALAQAVTLHSKPPKSWQDMLAHWQKYPDKKRDPNYWWNRGRFQEQKRLWRTAAGFYHHGAVVAKQPDDYPLFLREALMWRYLRQPDKAEAIYRDLVARYPDRMDAYIGLGDLARGRHAWEEAMTWYQKAWRAAPEHYTPPYYMGVTAYSAKRYREAIEYLNRSLALNPKAPWPWYYKAVALKALSRDQEAIAALEKAISLYKNPPSGWVKTLKQWQGEEK